MKGIVQSIGGLLFISLLLAHLFLIGLFVAPTDKLLGLLIENDKGFLVPKEVPEEVQNFLFINDVSVDGDYRLDQSFKGRLVLGALQFRRQYFVNGANKLALDMNLLNYGEGIIGLKAASLYYYKKPITQVSSKEWITLINLQKIVSKK